MTTETQPGRMPTNKSLTMLGGTTLAFPIVGNAVQEVWPQIAPAFMAGPAMTDALSALASCLVALIVTYWVPDRWGNPV